MSKAKDRARAESGLIFRDGQLWEKEDWYRLHPTREMRAATQQGVNAAVAAELEEKFRDKPYLCGKCGRKHKPGSKIYGDHKQFISEVRDEVSNLR